MLPWALFALAALRLVCGEFFTPATDGTEVWRVGEVHDVGFSSQLQKFTISCAQMNEGIPDVLGTPILEYTNGPVTKTSFRWEVDVHRFNLSTSNKFIFWLFEGDVSGRGDRTRSNEKSLSLNITEALPSSPSSTDPASSQAPVTSGVPTQTLPSSTVATQEPSISPSTTPPASQASSPPLKDDQPAGGKSSSGLSPGAMAGIGVGAGTGTIGLAAILGAVLWVRRGKRQQMKVDEQRRSEVIPVGYYDTQNWKPPYQSPPVPAAAELDSVSRKIVPPVELG